MILVVAWEIVEPRFRQEQENIYTVPYRDIFQLEDAVAGYLRSKGFNPDKIRNALPEGVRYQDCTFYFDTREVFSTRDLYIYLLGAYVQGSGPIGTASYNITVRLNLTKFVNGAWEDVLYYEKTDEISYVCKHVQSTCSSFIVFSPYKDDFGWTWQQDVLSSYDNKETMNWNTSIVFQNSKDLFEGLY